LFEVEAGASLRRVRWILEDVNLSSWRGSQAKNTSSNVLANHFGGEKVDAVAVAATKSPRAFSASRKVDAKFLPAPRRIRST